MTQTMKERLMARLECFFSDLGADGGGIGEFWAYVGGVDLGQSAISTSVDGSPYVMVDGSIPLKPLLAAILDELREPDEAMKDAEYVARRAPLSPGQDPSYRTFTAMIDAVREGEK